MRLLTGSILLLALMLAGCMVAVRHTKPQRHYRHSYHRHGWHSHHHWNAGGPAYAEAAKIRALDVLPVTLPDTITGEYTPEQERTWRANWGVSAAEWIANSATEAMEGDVDITSADRKPKSGYYLELVIEKLDVGKQREAGEDEERADWTRVFAKGRLINAQSNELVAEIKFDEKSGRYGEESRFEDEMKRVGHSLSLWLKERREE